MRAYVESVFDCPAERVWDKVQESALLLEVTWPLVRIVPVGTTAFPERWAEGETMRCKMYLLGVLPLGTHTIRMERIDQAACEIQSRESDPVVRKWDHLIRVRDTGDGKARYSDEIEIKAGWLTGLVWLFAQGFYRHRQRRWRRVARRLAGEAVAAH